MRDEIANGERDAGRLLATLRSVLKLEPRVALDYSETWETGFAKMDGSASFTFPATLELQKQPDGRYVAKGEVSLSGKASYSGKGLGFGRPTGVSVTSGALPPCRATVSFCSASSELT